METVVTGPLAVSVADAARMLSISRAALYPIVMSGEIASLTVGSRRLVPVEALRAWLNERTGGAA